MKNLLCLIAIVLVTISVYADEPVEPNDPNDSNSIEYRQSELSQKVLELQTKESELKVKTYSGTIQEILSERVADVNEAHQIAVDVNNIAVPLCPDVNLPDEACDYVRKAVFKKNDTLKTMLGNNEFLLTVETLISEPNVLPEPNDPNYAMEVQRLLEFEKACFEIASPR